MHAAMQKKLINACHDLSDGGLAVALAEMCLGGRLGARVNLDRVPVVTAQDVTTLLYSESASRLLVSVPRDAVREFQETFAKNLGYDVALIGNVADTTDIIATHNDAIVLRADVEAEATAFKQTFLW